MRNAIALMCLLCLSACSREGRIEITPLQTIDSADAKFGTMFLDANIAAAPFRLSCIGCKIEISGETDDADDSFPVNPGRYRLEFLEVEGYPNKPPVQDDLEVKKGGGFRIMAYYEE